MKVEISYFPPEKIITVPSPEATYPFEINGKFQYIVEFSCYIDGDYQRPMKNSFAIGWRTQIITLFIHLRKSMIFN